jgi:hypothetical protein
VSTVQSCPGTERPDTTEVLATNNCDFAVVLQIFPDADVFFTLEPGASVGFNELVPQGQTVLLNVYRTVGFDQPVGPPIQQVEIFPCPQ